MGSFCQTYLKIELINYSTSRLGRQLHAQHEHRRVIVDPRNGRAQPFLADLRLRLRPAIELVGERAADRIAVVLSRQTDISVDPVVKPHGPGEPSTERILELDAGVAREHAGGARHGGLGGYR